MFILNIAADKLKVSIILIATFQFLFCVKCMAQEYKKYNSEGISISYPITWETGSHASAKFLFFRPVEEVGQQFRENINLVESDNRGLELTAYCAACKAQLSKLLNGYKEISTEYLTINGKKFCQLVYQHNTNGLPLQAALFVCVHNAKAYQFTCSALQTTYEKFAPVFKKMMSSCEIK